MDRRKHLEKVIKTLGEDFEFIKDKVLGIVIFGSYAKLEQNKKSDIDVCIISPSIKPKLILKQIHQRIDVNTKNYDIKIFEELPLYLKAEVMKNYVVVTGDKKEIEEYFRIFRKIWEDQKHRQKLSREEIKRILSFSS